MYDAWIRAGNGRFGIHRLRQQRKRSEQIYRQTIPANALSLYWSIDQLLAPSEERIWKIVSDFDQWVDMEIAIARGK
jgi:hypothetical protein